MNMDLSDPRTAFAALLPFGNARVVAIHAACELPTTVLPMPDGTVCLEYGLAMPVPIEDLRVDDDGIRATLSFDRVPSQTFVPWGAVTMIQQQRPGHIVAVVYELQAAPQREPKRKRHLEALP